jgi:cytochrome c peroxidase
MLFPIFLTPIASEGQVWDFFCATCHNGSEAPTKEELLKKYPTKEKFLQAIENSKNPYMVRLKSQKELIRKALKELFGNQ